MAFQRPYFQQLTDRLKEERLRLQVVVGPRQVGKTTLIGQVLESLSIPYDSHTADDIQSAGQAWLATIWENARLKMRMQAHEEYLLVIDEIQKIPNWSETVKAEWDRDTREKRNLKVVLLGSSRLLIMQGLTESLAGRFELLRLPHWSLSEMEEAFGWTVEQFIYYGGYPGAAPYVGDPLRWRQYVKDSLVEPSIARDVLGSTRVLKPQLLRQLFEIGSSYSGELLALKKVAGQLQDAGNATTLSGYLTLLSEAGLLSGLQKYAADTARKYNSVPKFQVHNSALRNIYENASFEEAVVDSIQWGRLAESAVGAYLISQAALCDYELYYWREGANEVDYILCRRGRLVAIEVKSGRRQRNSGMAIFADRFHPFRSLYVGGADGISIEDFLRMDLRILFK